jgi:hypothetical protein
MVEAVEDTFKGTVSRDEYFFKAHNNTYSRYFLFLR